MRTVREQEDPHPASPAKAGEEQEEERWRHNRSGNLGIDIVTLAEYKTGTIKNCESRRWPRGQCRVADGGDAIAAVIG
jgi:hypothetical protein